MSENGCNEIDISNYLTAIFYYKYIIIGIACLGILCASFYVSTIRDAYESKSIIQNPSPADIISYDRITNIIYSHDFINPVFEKYNTEQKDPVTLDAFTAKYKVETVDRITFKFTTKSNTPEDAQRLNQRIIARYIEYMSPKISIYKESLKNKIAIVQSTSDGLKESAAQLKTEIRNFIIERKITPEPAFKSIMLSNLYSDQIKKTGEELEKLQLLKENLLNVEDVKILNYPTFSKRPIQAVNKFKFVITVGLICILAAIILVLFIDYLRKCLKVK
jgi:LPS O-antigen subunit length determinant protein (WzzB/FepE family)